MARRAVHPSLAPNGRVWGIAGVSGRNVEQEENGSTDDRPELRAVRSIRSLLAGTLYSSMGNIDRFSSGKIDETRWS